MPNGTNNVVLIPRKHIPQVLNRARNGSSEDLEKIVNAVKHIPFSFYSGMLDLFVSHLTSEDVYMSASSSSEEHGRLAISSLQGICNLTATVHFLATPSLSTRILQDWLDIAKTIAYLYDAAKQRHGEICELPLFRSVPTILMAVDKVDNIGASEAFLDSCFQSLISTLWLEYPGNDHHIIQQLAWSLNKCSEQNHEGIMNNLLKACTKRHSEKVIATRAIKQVESFIKPRPSSVSRWDLSGIRKCCYALSTLARDHITPMAAAVVENGGDAIILKLLNIIVKRIPRGIMERQGATLVTTACFYLLNQYFRIKPGVLRKSVRAGLLTFIAKLLPFYGGNSVDSREGINEIKLIFTEVIPRDLIWIKSVVLLASTIKIIMSEDRKILSEGILGQQWKDVENLLIERLVFLKCTIENETHMGCETVSYLVIIMM